MKSIKPGRGPSMMNGIVGIFMIGFGVLWTVLAAQGSLLFSLFGVLWTGIAVVQTVYEFKNATRENRYSTYDIVDDYEETDSLNERFGKQKQYVDDEQRGYCPYCGKKTEKDFLYCAYCGRKTK